MKRTALSLSLVLVACQPTAPLNAPTAKRSAAQSTSQKVAVSKLSVRPMKHYPVMAKPRATGQVQLKEQQLQLSLNLYPEAAVGSDAFKTQLLDLSNATRLLATVTDSHGKTYNATTADGNGAVNYTGGTITLTFENVIPDPLLFVTVQARNGTTDIVQADLASVIKHTGTNDVTTTINFQTSVAARAMQTLLGSNAARARAIDLTALETLTASITGVTGTAPNFTYPNNHPSLVNTAQLATDLVNDVPGDLTASDYRQSGATVALTVSGLSGSDKLQVQITDAASARQTNLGNGTTNITGVTPGSNIAVQASAFGTPAETYSAYTPSPASLTLTEGGTTNLTVTASLLKINNFSPAAGPAGTVITVNGSGFSNASTATVGGGSAPVTFVSATQIQVTVPATATDGVIAVAENGSTVNSTSSFDVHRRIHVNDDASGNNNGTSWANAYNSLRAALTAADAQDEVWIAEGTYTPHASDRDISFEMKENVNIYGGFEGTENALGDRTPSLTDFITVLSGDLSNNDNYTTPGTTLDENSYHVIEGANNAILDGVTIQGGKADASSANATGGGMYNFATAPTLNNITFSNNSAEFGGGMYNISSNPTLTNITFSNNSADFGGGVYNISANPTLNNTTFWNNSANFGGGMYNQVSNPILNNVTFSNNPATNSGGGIHNNTGNAILTNVLFFNSTRSSQPLGSNGSIDVGSTDPFVNSANPNGADGIPRTTDDGLRIAFTASTVVNQGVTGAGVPTTDILGNSRVGIPEPGAYEFVPPPLPANVIAVHKDATGSNDGSSWGNAFTTVQAALSAATAGKEIWIAAGTYKPNATNTNTGFQLKNNVDIYGGFTGIEGLRSERDFINNVTVLSGDFNADDNYTSTPAGNISDNATHVLGWASNITVDGLTIQGGNADGGDVGGALLADSGSATFKNIVFKHNHADARGGTIYSSVSSTELNFENVLVTHSSSPFGMINLEGGAGISTAKNMVFKDNVVLPGPGQRNGLVLGGMLRDTLLENLVFVDNTAGGSVFQANLFNGFSTSVTLTIKNMLVVNNNLSDNVPIDIGGDAYTSTNVHNLTQANNQCPSQCQAFIVSHNTILDNLLFWKDTPAFNASRVTDNNTVDLGSSGTPFLNSADPDGADNIFFTADDGYHPVAANAGVNAGNTNTGVPATDIANSPRVGNTDVGAYEYTP